MTRALYRLLLILHPPAFRRRFAEEMLGIYDSTVATEGGVLLLVDGLRSVIRQWIIRERLWIFTGAIAGGLLTTSAVHIAAPQRELVRAVEREPTPVVFFVVAVASFLTIALTMIFTVVWFRAVQKGRRKRA
jgi:hypothetical protein